MYCTPTTTPATGISENDDKRRQGLRMTDDLPVLLAAPLMTGTGAGSPADDENKRWQAQGYGNRLGRARFPSAEF